jgi:ADP-heptose:LPS heptosyltransferase
MTARVLILRPGSLGDTVVALPCLKLIRRTFPDAELRMLTNRPVASTAPSVAAILEGMDLVDTYLEYPIATRSPAKLWHLAREIRRWRPDMLVHLARREKPGQVRRDAAFFRACGIRRIVGLPSNPDLLRNRRQPDGTFEREAERLARTIAAVGPIDLADPAAFDLGLSEADRALPRRLIVERIGGQPFIAVSIGTKQPANDWGVENWRALCAQLCRLYPHRLVLTGAEEDRAGSDAVIAGLGERAVNLCGLKVRENAALIETASLFIGHDSGPMHMAAAVGTPLVAIFSRLWSPGIWYPMSSRAVVLYPTDIESASPSRGEAIQAIMPSMVIDAVRALMAATL